MTNAIGSIWKGSLAIVVLTVASGVASASLLIGTPSPSDIQDCVPFGCSTHAQFLYKASDFSGPITITGLTFFNSVEDGGDTFQPATYTWSLSTTAAGSLSSTFADNRGADFQTFASYLQGPDPIPTSFTISGTPFNYDPANGNLLLEVTKPDASSFGGFTDYNSGNGLLIGRVWSTGGDFNTGAVDPDYGPVVQFETGSGPVPEPATFALLGLGLLGAAGLRLRKFKKAA